MRTTARLRIDKLLVERGLVESREQGLRVLLAGHVLVAGRRVDKAGTLVETTAPVEVRSRPRYVSRGGDKLAHALTVFDVRVEGRVCLDVGASTGGFTDCLLQRGAGMVCAVDVGHAQLDSRLRADPRVVVMERTNARVLPPLELPGRPDLAVVDVSFISLEMVLPAVFDAVTPGEVIALVKPQFEAGREAVGKGGVVRDGGQHRVVLNRVARFALGLGWTVRSITPSPLRGPKGNREFFLYLAMGGAMDDDLTVMIERAVGGDA